MSEQPTAPAGGAPRRSGLKTVFVAVVFILLLGGGAAAFWMMKRPAADAPVEAPPPAPPGIVALDPFVVNLADPGGTRFLRLTLRLVVEGEEHAKEVSEDEVVLARVRSTILELLTLQTAERLVTPDGKAALKKEIGERAAHAMHEVKVLDVLFSEFVVQF